MGNTKSIIDGVNGGTTSYIYDVHNRLSSSLASGYSIGAMNYSRSVSFAKNGNITAKSGVGSYSYQANNHQVTKAGSFDFSYDANGNMLTKLSNVSLVKYKYDARDVLSQVTNAYVGDDGGRWAKFSYDAFGQRVRKWSSTGNVVLYPNGYYAIKNSKWTNNHIYAGSERICTLVNGEPSFIHRDQIHSGGAITTNGGLVGDKVAFAPYGEVLYQQNTNSTLEEKFTGQILDEETGLYYYNARYYNPKIGVFISADTIIPDPYDSQSMNRYMYVRGNPVKYVDPTGHCAGLIVSLVAITLATIDYYSDGAVTEFFNDNNISVDIQGSYSIPIGSGGSQGVNSGGGVGPTVQAEAPETARDIETYSSMPIEFSFLIKGKPFATFLMARAMRRDSSRLDIETKKGDYLYKLITKNPDYKNFVSKMLTINDPKERAKMGIEGFIFQRKNSADLYFALKRVKVVMTPSGNAIRDKYDFRLEGAESYKTFMLNNLAAIGQGLGILSSYNIWIWIPTNRN